MYTDKHGNKRFKLGLHVHTTLSDGQVPPEKAARIYKDAGYDAIALTDHWKYHGEDEIEGLKIIPGAEYNLAPGHNETNTMHIVGLGMKKDPMCEKDMTRQQIIDRINAAGGIAVLAHPYWSLNTPEDALSLKNIAATEIYNSVSDAHESFRPYSGYFVDLTANKGLCLPLIAADDSHYYDGTDETKSFIMAKAESLDTDGLLSAVKDGRFYATQGPELLVTRKQNVISVDCSPADRICFISNIDWCPGRVIRKKGSIHAEYELCGAENWLRVEINSQDGDAWSNFIDL